MKKITYGKVLPILLAAFCLVGCGNEKETIETKTDVIDEVEGIGQPESPTKEPAQDEADANAEIIPSDFTYPEWDEEDLNTDFSSEDVQIVEEEGVITITGEGVVAEKGNVTITQAGTYVLSGNFQGQILVEAGKEDLVHLVLKGADISCENSAAIFGSQSEKIVITLADGTKNSVSDGEVYEYAEEGEDEPDAAIFSKDNLVINGKGFLTVAGNYGDGICSKDDLWIVSGEFDITAKGDAVKGKDSLWIAYGQFVVNAGDAAFKASNEEDADKGWTLIEGGSYEVTAVGDAFHAETYMIIEDGTVDVKACEEGIEGLKVEIYDGDISVVSTDDGINAANGNLEEDLEKESAKIAIYGGKIFVDAEGDGMDSNGVLYIYGGEITVEGPTGNDNAAIDYETTALIKEGILLATGSAGMAIGFSQQNEQGWILYNLPEKMMAGETIIILNEKGETLFTASPNKEYQSIVLSTPEFENGETYTLVCGDVEAEFTLENNTYSNGRGFGPGGGGFGPGGEGKMPGGEMMPGGEFAPGEFPEGMTPPEGMEMPGGMEPPEGMPEMPEGMEPPEGMPQMPPEEQ